SMCRTRRHPGEDDLYAPSRTCRRGAPEPHRSGHAVGASPAHGVPAGTRSEAPWTQGDQTLQQPMPPTTTGEPSAPCEAAAPATARPAARTETTAALMTRFTVALHFQRGGRAVTCDYDMLIALCHPCATLDAPGSPPRHPDGGSSARPVC